MEAILKAALPLEIRAVISNRPDARGLTTAKAAGIATEALDHKSFASREAFDTALMQSIDKHQPDYVVLAGFMRVLTTAFIDHFPDRIINIHPSLLPSFPGLHTHRQALDTGVKVHGVTVHLVTPTLDHGPIIAQAAVPVLPDDTEDTLAARVLVQEHLLYPQALRWIAEDRVGIDANGVVRIRGLDVVRVHESLHLRYPTE
jgi:phosphoribosylglycinamide formyltransferase-1